MKAAVVTAAGKTPVYRDFNVPTPAPGFEVVAVRGAALTHFTKGRASGEHYSSDHAFPAVAGSDGVGITADGRRVYFVLPEAPFGAMAEFARVRSRQCIEVPAEVDDITAAAIANPGMSAWAALAERAQLKAGETVLINGATGIAGRLAVQIAKFMGAAKVVATGRDEAALEEMKSLGVDVSIPFALGTPDGVKKYEEALMAQCAAGVDVVIDYLWGASARTVIGAIAKAAESGKPVRFVQVGSSSGEDIQLPAAALRSSAIMMMGSGVKSVPMSGLLAAIQNTFAAVVPARLKIAAEAVPLEQVAERWDAAGKTRIVFVPPQASRE